MQKAGILIFCFIWGILGMATSQPLTGVWRGRVVKGHPPFATTYKLEVKIIRQGDSLTGTSYYYANKANYYRYAIKGYLDDTDGSLHWWDDALLEQKGTSSAAAPMYRQPLQLQADFNCPGAGVMTLDGLATTDADSQLGVHLNKTEAPLFADGWDPLIENWLFGGANPDAIAEAGRQQQAIGNRLPVPAAPTTGSTASAPPAKPATTLPPAMPPTAQPGAADVGHTQPQPAPLPVPLLTTRQKFDTRLRQVQTIIPVAGDSIELQFFDNAEIDGDSIALFLNDEMLMEHIKLSAQPFIIKLAVADLPPNAELSMVAENLGAIPPNTSFMMAYVNGQRYTARLESTEGTTAVIRFKK